VTVIFITIYPFNKDYAKKYGFGSFKEKGISIVIVNIFPIIYREEVEEQAGYVDFPSVTGVEQVRVRSQKEFEEKLIGIEGQKIAILVVHPYNRILKCLKRTGVDYIVHFLNYHPVGKKINKPILDRLTQNIKQLFCNPVLFISKCRAKLCQYIPNSVLGVDFPRYVIVGGYALNIPYPLSDRQIIYTHSFDYDRYLQNMNLPRDNSIPDYEYYVFLSCSTWDVHDYLLSGIKAVINKDEYEEIIVKAFDFIEDKTGKKIIIAAGPKASDSEDVYNGRPYIGFNTEQLVKYSAGVICHYSGAINFAVIHNKPICFTTIRKLDNDKYFTRFVNAYADELGADINYIDTDRDLNSLIEKDVFYYNRDKFDNYANKYLKSKLSQGELCWGKISNVLINEYFVQQ